MSGLIATVRRHLQPYSPRPEIHQALFRRPLRLNLPHPIVSFTFDDFPRSALLEGGPLLQHYGGRGTYYAALGLMDGGDYENGVLYTRADLDRLIADGHEIGCHSYSHHPARRISAVAYEKDILRNRARMQEILPGHPLENFSYPGGSVTLRVKRRMRHHAHSSRGTYCGINRHTADLDLLLCQNLYDNVPLQHVQSLMDDVRANPGWIIFYGHDVRAHPTHIGCTPAYLESVLKIVSPICPILTIAQALAQLQPAPRSP